jgi:hypothetical protein
MRLWYVRRKPCSYIAPTLTLSPSGSKWDSTWPTHQGVPLGASKMIFLAMVRSTQTMHLSCVKISTISKLTQICFHLSLVTKEYRLVCPKRLRSLLDIRRKPCSYIAPNLTQSPNGPKQDSTWRTPQGVPIGASMTIFLPMVRSTQTTHLSCVKISTIFKRTQTSFHLSLVT